MKKSFLFYLLLASMLVPLVATISMAAVGYTVTFQNPTVAAGHFTIDVYVLKTGTTNFRVGNANFWFTYNSSGLSTPTIKTHGAYNVASDDDYLTATITSGSFSGLQYVSYNTFFNTDGVTGADQAGTVPLATGNGTFACTIDFVITNAALTSTLAFQPSGYALTTDVGGDVTGSGTWTNTSSTVLPVEISAFTASSSRLNAELKWSTATEVNNFGFDIERRSVDIANSSWAKVGFVAGAGTSNTQHDYSYSEAGISAGRYAYRLKQVDNDGSFKYSQSMEVEIGLATKELTLCDNYPNPFNPTTSIEFTVAQDGKASLKVYNAIGQEVANLYNGDAKAGRIIQTRFDATRLASGIYYSRLQVDGKSLVKRMMFVK
jgi:hypothetical protein